MKNCLLYSGPFLLNYKSSALNIRIIITGRSFKKKIKTVLTKSTIPFRGRSKRPIQRYFVLPNKQAGLGKSGKNGVNENSTISSVVSIRTV